MDNNDKHLQYFLYVVSTFEMAAMQGMGKINNPATGKIEKNLEQAQFAIDVLDMLKEKTKGNLSDYETRFLDTLTSQLKLNYVDEVSKKTEAKETVEPEEKGEETKSDSV